MLIRKAEKQDLSRIAEIFVFNNRVNFYPIFQDVRYSFGELQVASQMDGYFGQPEIFDHLYVYDDVVVKGFVLLNGTEIDKLFVDPFFQNHGVGHALLCFAMEELGGARLWALKKNTRAISFYQRHGFILTGKKKFEEDTDEYLLEMACKPEFDSPKLDKQGG